MRIQLTSVEETNNAEEIQRKIKVIFPNYTVTVVPNKYATKEGKEQVKAYSKQYYQKNAEKQRKDRRERYYRQKAEREMAIMEENFELTKGKKGKEYER